MGLYGGTCVVLYTLVSMSQINDYPLTIQGHCGSGNEGRKFGKSKHGELRTGKQGMEGEGKERCQILNQDIQLCLPRSPFQIPLQRSTKSPTGSRSPHQRPSSTTNRRRMKKGRIGLRKATRPRRPPPHLRRRRRLLLSFRLCLNSRRRHRRRQWRANFCFQVVYL